MLAPNYLLRPTQLSPATGPAPLITWDSANLLGGMSSTPFAPTTVAGLAENALSPLTLPTLNLTALGFGTVSEHPGLADLSPAMLSFIAGDQQPAVFGGAFIPYRVMPWPGIPVRTAPAIQDTSQYSNNALLLGSSLGLAASGIGSIANAGANLGNIGNIGNIR